MNKTLNINLGGYPIVINDDAYVALSNYLKAIERHFADSESASDIIQDIESRMAELFLEHAAGRPIIEMHDVEAAIAIMGRPEVFGAEAGATYDEDSFIPDPDGSANSSSFATDAGIKTGKRMYRDPDNTVLAGVCGGLSAYFGINDPLWMRLAFVAVTLLGYGFGVVLYLVLWVILPVANSAREKLAMRGEPINVNSIADTIEQEVNRITKQFTSEDGKKKMNDQANAFGERVANGVRWIGPVMQSIVRPIPYIIIGALLLAFAAAWVGLVFSWIVGAPYLHFFAGVGRGSMLAASVLTFVTITMIGFSLFFIRGGFGYRAPRAIRTGLWSLWGLSLLSFFLTASFQARSFSVSRTIEGTSADLLPVSDTLVLTYTNVSQSRNDIRIDGLVFDDDAYYMENVDINVRTTTGNTASYLVAQTARGSTYTEAERLADAIDYPIKQEGSRLELPVYLRLPRPAKFRAQRAVVSVFLPEGMRFRVESAMYDDRWYRSIDGFDSTNAWSGRLEQGKVYEVQNGAYRCLTCEDEEKQLQVNATTVDSAATTVPQ